MKRHCVACAGILSAAIGMAAALGAAPASSPPTASGPAELTVKLDQHGVKISPMLYGLMTEEINYSYDGGLYGELIQNRIFKNPRRSCVGGEDPPVVQHWATVTSGRAQADTSTDDANPVNATALTTSLHLSVRATGAGERAGVANDGYWGIPVRPNTTYSASFYARSGEGFSGPLTVDIESSDGKTIFASGTVDGLSGDWKKYALKLTTGADAPVTADARFVISGTSKGSVWFNLVSLFPPTYKDRPNGNRADIMELLADLHPAFLRFPGGNFVEGNDLANRFDWKKTIGPLEDRPGHMSPWNYRSTDGLGLLEFCEWCEDLNMEPVLAVFAGYTLNRQTVPEADYARYAEEAVEEIEYVTGDVSTPWGARRAKDGHAAPFKLHYVEIGNEDNINRAATTYDARFTVFYDAIKAKYPELKIIATGPQAKMRQYDVIDEHYYMNVKSGATTGNRYDDAAAYSRSEPWRVFIGEWATRDGKPTAAFNAALSDAVFLTSLERNSDMVVMTCYAPLFDNVDKADGHNVGGQQWATDLIGYNAVQAFGGASYYVQKLFYNNRGDETVPHALTAGDAMAQDAWASCTKDDATGEVIVKLVSRRATATEVTVSLEGATQVEKHASGWILTAGLDDVNSVGEPTKVSPKEMAIDNAAAKFTYTLPARAVVVLRVKAK